MDAPKNDKQDTKDQDTPKEENVYEGISVKKFISILESKGWKPEDTQIQVLYKGKPVR